MSTQGKDAIAFTESLVVGDIAGLKDGTGSLSCFTNEKGGIIDDTVITKVRGSFECFRKTAQYPKGELERRAGIQTFETCCR
jgi:glycine cleavage system aminomethyltransferase T